MLPEHTVLTAPNTITQLQPPSHLSHQATSSHHKVLKSTAMPQLTLSAPLQLQRVQTRFCTIKGKWTRVCDAGQTYRMLTRVKPLSVRCTSFIPKVAMPSSCYRWPCGDMIGRPRRVQLLLMWWECTTCEAALQRLTTGPNGTWHL